MSNMSSWDDESPLPLTNNNPSNTKASASKLSSLFAQEESIAHTGNTALAFTAKKAPKQQPVNQQSPSPTPASQPNATPPPTSGTTVIFACAANLIRYDAAGSPQMIGARACTILRNQTVNPSTGQAVGVHALVCYDPTNQKQECIATLNESFSLTLSPPSYAMFYDDQRTYYCVQLTPDQLEQLAKHIALTKHAQLSQSSQQTPVITQDLTAINPSDKPIQTGDQIKIKYTMSLTSATHPKGIGAVIGAVGSDEKPKPMRVGSKKELAGIEQGVIGMRKNGRRLLIIPSHLAYGAHAAGAVPANSVIVVDISVLKVKHAESNAAPTTEPIAQSTAVASPVAVVETQTSAVTPTPNIIIQTVPQLPSVATVTAPSHPSSVESEDAANDSDEQRTMLTKKMSNLGFRMPGLPGALDPEHSTAQQHANINPSTNQLHVQPQSSRRDSFDSIDDSDAGSIHSFAPSPNPVNQSVPSVPQQQTSTVQSTYQPLSQQSTAHQSSISSMPSHPNVNQNAIPSSAGHTRVHSHTSLASMAGPHPGNHHSGYQPVSQNYYNQSSPSHGYHNMQSSPHTAIQPNYAHSFASPEPYPLSNHMQSPSAYNGMYHPHQSNQHSASVNAAQIMNIEAKLDAIQTQLIQTSRSIGASATAVFDAPLTGVQLIKAIQSILSERDEARSKLIEQDKKCSDLTAKVEVNEERYERRFESYSDEIKMKNSQILELQANTRRLEQENQSMHAANRTINQSVDQHSVAKAELERQLQQLNAQLDEANTKIVSKDVELAFLKQQLEQSNSQVSTQSEDHARALSTLQTQLEHQKSDSEQSINQLNQSIVQLEKERLLLQEELEQQKKQLADSTLASQSASELQAVIDSLRSELQKSREETDAANKQAQQVRESDHALMLETLAQSKMDEFERGREAALDEVREAMASMKEKARLAIESIDQAKSEAEERASVAETERDEIIENSRAYIERMKAQMAAKLAEIEDEQSNQASPEAISQTLKQLYNNLSKVLQEYGEYRWRPFEIAQLAKVEIAFILTGERQEFTLAQTDEDNDSQPRSASAEPLLPAESLEATTPVTKTALHDNESNTNATESSEHVPDVFEQPSDASEQPTEQVQHTDAESESRSSVNIAEESAVSVLEPLIQHSDESALQTSESSALSDELSADLTPVARPVEEAQTSESSSHTDESSADLTPVAVSAEETPLLEHVSSTQIDGVPTQDHDIPDSISAVSSASDADTETDHSSQEPNETSSGSSAFEVVTPSSSTDSTSQLNGDYVVVDADKPGDTVPLLTDDEVPAETQVVSDSAESITDKGAVDVDTFEHPVDNHIIAASVHAAVIHPDSHATELNADDEDEQADQVAPLPTLVVDTSTFGSNYITPPTPTLLTPPASSLRLINEENNAGGERSSPTGTLISPTVLTSTPHAIVDPFDEQDSSFASSFAQTEKPRAAPAKKVTKNKLFDDDEEDSLFVAPATRPKKPAAKAKVAAALFGDDSDDDDILFRR